MLIVAVTLESPGLSAMGVIVSDVIVPVDEVDVPLTKVSGSVGLAGDRFVSVTVESMLVCIMQASKIFIVWMQTFSHSPFIGLPLMFPGHLSGVELLLQKDIFLPPFYLLQYMRDRAFCCARGVLYNRNIDKSGDFH